jgi:hypothetical protein
MRARGHGRCFGHSKLEPPTGGLYKHLSGTAAEEFGDGRAFDVGAGPL